MSRSITQKPETETIAQTEQTPQVTDTLPAPPPIVLHDRLDSIMFGTLQNVRKYGDSLNQIPENERPQLSGIGPVITSISGTVEDKAWSVTQCVSILDFQDLNRSDSAGYTLFPTYKIGENSDYWSYHVHQITFQVVKKDTTFKETFEPSGEYSPQEKSRVVKTKLKKGELLICSDDYIICHTFKSEKAKQVLYDEFTRPWDEQSEKCNLPVDGFYVGLHTIELHGGG